MKLHKYSALFAIVAVALPVTSAAFGWGATKQEGPWNPYTPYGPYGPPPGSYVPQGYAPQWDPSQGPPPWARNVKGVMGSGPGMTWGNPKRERPARKEEAAKPYERLHRPWTWSKPWPSSPRYEQRSRPRAVDGMPGVGEKPLSPSVEQQRPNFGAGWQSRQGSRGNMPPGWERYQYGGGAAATPAQAPEPAPARIQAPAAAGAAR